jgi:hypothetical protein
LQCHSVSKTRFKNRYSKTNAQKKWAVKTRPFGREALIVTRRAPRCKQFPCLKREPVHETRPWLLRQPFCVSRHRAFEPQVVHGKTGRDQRWALHPDFQYSLKVI